ncbi:flavin-containing amine oxidoreductase-domain containing protein [Xylogone sp. PMI_703]|nr:flavin-containing amine oxidoreductase-domain containing protein [Xylogone sp. PMI_703]
MVLRPAAAFLGAVALATSAQSSAIPNAKVSLTVSETVEVDGLSNIHVTYHTSVDGPFSIHYGSCDTSAAHPSFAFHAVGSTHVGNHHLAEHLDWDDRRPTRFVWIVPESVVDGGCLHAYSGEDWMGSSGPINVIAKKAKRASDPSIDLADIADTEGPWFDGVAYLKAKEPSKSFVAKAKAKEIGILGGGMSGLMTSLLLESVGIKNWKIIESTNRVGGRLHTSYLNNTRPDQYQYQEMGPMRFPVSITYPDTNETLEIQDHKMVFQLADTVNKLNKHNPDLEVNFITWIQSAANDPASTDKRRPDGTVPGNAEIQANKSLANTPEPADPATAPYTTLVDDYFTLSRTNITEMATNMFKAHRKAVDAGYLGWSEANYLRYHLGASIDITDKVDSLDDTADNWLYDNVYFSATHWRTIDKGLSSLPRAITPLVQSRTLFNSVVNRLDWNEKKQKMTVYYRPRDDPWAESTTKEFDYVVTAVPFTRVRLWQLPQYSLVLSNAIQRYAYEASCKVALLYETRFWEHLEHPIIGGCGSVNITGIGSICYPSYNINGTGPGVILASYESGVGAAAVGAFTEEEHVAFVQRAMVAVHGEIAAKQYTGVYDRVCWAQMPDQGAAWAAPDAGQQQLYIPAFFQTEMNTVFVGEHTSYTHAWIFSALESATRGTTQLLLEMGLVDEAKQITKEWMARWISV